MVNVRPMAPFLYLYPFEHARLMEIAYYFDFDYADGREPSTYSWPALELANVWMAEAERGLLALVIVLEGWRADVFLCVRLRDEPA